MSAGEAGFLVMEAEREGGGGEKKKKIKGRGEEVGGEGR